jgi:hypothetical protein
MQDISMEQEIMDEKDSALTIITEESSVTPKKKEVEPETSHECPG